MAGVSQRLADFGFQKASKPKPTASKSVKGKEKENLKDPTQVFDGMLLKLSKIKVLQGPPSRHILGPDGLPISSMSMFKLYTFDTVISGTSVPNTVVPYNIQQDDEALSAEEDHTLVNSEGYVPPPKNTTAPCSYEDAFSTRYKFDHDFSPELAFEIELEAMTRGCAALSIDYLTGASKSQKVVRKVTRYRAGGLRGAGGLAFVNRMAYKSPREYLLLCVYIFSLLMYSIIQVLDLLVKLSRMTDTSDAKIVSPVRSSRGHLL